MAVGQGGFYCNNLTIATAAQLSASQLVPVDTQAVAGAAPQTLGATLGLLAQNNLTATGITAHAGGGQTAAFQLDYGVSNITVVATAADSLKLPPSLPGKWCYLRNSDSTDSMTVFGYGTDTIDGVASATGNAQAAGKGKLYFCISGDGGVASAGVWVSLLGA